MLFPWVGMLEQIRLADVFVHYDDVQFSKGSFVNRVQLKLPEGSRWMTVPLQRHHLGQRIDQVQTFAVAEWRDKHLDLLNRSLGMAPHARDALEIAEQVYAKEYPNLAALARASLLALVHYFGLEQHTRFIDVSTLQAPGSGSERVLSVMKQLSGDVYITGHGALNYLDHERFERSGIQVEYINYQKRAYPQLHGVFTPYVSGLDLVAHCGRDGIKYICSGTTPWRALINESD